MQNPGKTFTRLVECVETTVFGTSYVCNGAPDMDVRPGKEEGEGEGKAKEREEERGEEVDGEGGHRVDGQAGLPCHGVDGQAVAI